MINTNRRNSDIYAPFGELQAREDRGHPLESIPLKKIFFAAVWSATTTAVSWDLRYTTNWTNFLPIKVFGQWLGNRLPNEDLTPTIQKCYFCLAFGNSNYKDYITEKLWRNSFISRVIPVVFGVLSDDYKAAASPHISIHVDEFATIKDLADYVKKLTVDKKCSNEYFTWGEGWETKSYSDLRNGLSKVCTKYDSLPAYKVYSDLEAWAWDKDTLSVQFFFFFNCPKETHWVGLKKEQSLFCYRNLLWLPLEQFQVHSQWMPYLNVLLSFYTSILKWLYNSKLTKVAGPPVTEETHKQMLQTGQSRATTW